MPKNYDFIMAIGDDTTDEDMFRALLRMASALKWAVFRLLPNIEYLCNRKSFLLKTHLIKPYLQKQDKHELQQIFEHYPNLRYAFCYWRAVIFVILF